MIAVAATAFLAVAREGLETALFFWSAVQAAGSTLSRSSASSLGVATSIVIAWLLYRRSVSLDLARFFTWTGAGLVVVAAGVLAYGVHDLQEGGVLGGLDNLAFDISAQVPPSSWYGTLLKGTINLSPQTTVLQAIVWTLYIVPVMVLFFCGRPAPAAPRRERRAHEQRGLAAARPGADRGGLWRTPPRRSRSGAAKTRRRSASPPATAPARRPIPRSRRATGRSRSRTPGRRSPRSTSTATGPDHRRGREHRPVDQPRPRRRADARQLRGRVQARHDRQGHPPAARPSPVRPWRSPPTRSCRPRSTATAGS